MPKGELKAKGAATQGTEVEEPGATTHRFLCTKEVGTPKGRALIGENSLVGWLVSIYPDQAPWPG